MANSNVRQIIASRLTESKSTVPHHFLSTDCQLDNLLSVRKALNGWLSLLLLLLLRLGSVLLLV